MSRRITKRQRALEARIVGILRGGRSTSGFGCSATCRCDKHRWLWRMARRIATMKLD